MRKKGVCRLCGGVFSPSELVSGDGVRSQIRELIQKDYPDWREKDTICRKDFERYRMQHIRNMIEEETGALKELEDEVLKSINEDELVSSDVNKSYSERLSAGDRISDRIAAFGGSWRFIIIFIVVLALWIAVNSVLLVAKPYDPYPFILLNLILSCIAALQAPVIMMSQNRQEKKDRLRSESDYKINLKSELEIRTLHEKVDHLLLVQWSKMMELQELQVELLEDLSSRLRE